MDNVLLLNNGKITHQGKPQDILNELGYGQRKTPNA